MSHRFRHEEKFSGKLGKKTTGYLKTYKEARVYYKLSGAQVLQNLHNLFGGESKCFYRDKDILAFNNYAQAQAFPIKNIAAYVDKAIRNSTYKKYH